MSAAGALDGAITLPGVTSRLDLRRRLLGGLAACVVVTGAAYSGWELVVGSHYVSTDNAYVGADVAEVTPLVAGPVRQVLVAETQAVHAGDALVLLDDADQRIALAAATAELSKAERQVRGYFANDDALAAQVAARNADIAHAQAGLDSAQADFNRVKSEYGHRQTLAPAGYASGEEVTRAGAALQVAAATLAAARAACDQAAAAEKAAMATLEANKVLTDGTTVETNPEVMAARTRVEQARLDLDRTIIRAPLDGVVTRRQVQIGDRAQIGAPLMDIVPVGATFVDANFKEAQLRDVRIGQPVELVSDLYGSSVRYHGRVVGLSGGTGAAFAVIPAQNATGNWIKVVQRLPVRIAFDAGELARNPVRVGLSMTAVIDTAGTGH